MDRGSKTGSTDRSTLFRAIWLASLMLTACGGGGGDSSNPQEPSPMSAPVASNGCSYAELNRSLNVTLSGRDAQGEPLSYRVVDSPQHGSLTPVNPLTGEYTYTPNTNARGTDRFTFRVDNGRLSSALATYDIVYTPRIMPLGDSITWGVTDGGSNPPLAQRVAYRKALRDAIVAGGYRVDFVGTLRSGTDGAFLPDDPEHEGHGGWTAERIVNGHPNPDAGTGTGKLTDWLDATQPDIVLLHIGTNDLNGGSDPVAKAEDVDALLGTIESWQQAHWPVTVILAKIIDRNPGATSTTSFNDALIDNVYPRHLAGARIIWVDQQRALSAADYADDAHPNDTGYRKMADVWRYPLIGGGLVTGSHTGAGILSKCP